MTARPRLARFPILPLLAGSVRGLSGRLPLALKIAARADVDDDAVLERLINETMRCYPPLPVIGREASSDDRLGDVAIPRGAIVVIFIYGTHHRADLWEDPDRFDPNRFLSKQAVPGAFLPLGLGPRACVGASFAILEMKIAFTAVLRAFRIPPDARGSPPPTLIPMVSLRTERPVFIRLEPR